MSEFEGLCESDYWSRNKLQDHWKGSHTRGSPKGRIVSNWNHVSASQIENFSKCKRLWFFKSILKIPEAQKGHQSLGEGFHLIMEKVPKGLTVDHSDVNASPEDWAKAEAMAKQALPLLPKETPDNPHGREIGIRMPTFENGPTMVGYIDLAIPKGVGWPALMIPPEEIIIADYKTLSDFRYMKTPQELADSIQMMVYAKWAMDNMGIQEKDPDGLTNILDNVRLVHLYARTKPPFIRSAIRNTDALVTPSEINTKWEKTLDVVREMQHISTACTGADEVEAGGALNGHCEAYGGCHFRDKCGISPVSGIKQLFSIGKKPTPTETPDMSGSAILEKIRAAQAAQQAKAASANPSPPATVTPTANVTVPMGEVVNPATSGHTAQVANQGNQPSGTNASYPGTTANPATTSTAGTITPKGPVSGLMAKIQKSGKGIPALSGSVGQAYAKEQGYVGSTGNFAGGGELHDKNVSTLGELMKLASGVVPPDAPSRAQEVITRPGDAVADPLKTLEPSEDDEDGDGDSVDATNTTGVGGVSTGSVESTPMGTQSVAEAPKKRGRPSREEMAAREAAEKAKFDAAVSAEVQKQLSQLDPARFEAGLAVSALEAERVNLGNSLAQVAAERDALTKANEALQQQIQGRNAYPTPQQEGLTLYIDCFPTKGDKEVQDFFEWIGPICAQVAQQNSVGDWRQINYTAKGLLANAIRETVKEHGAPKSLTVSSYAGGADIALEILTPIAKRVIKKL